MSKPQTGSSLQFDPYNRVFTSTILAPNFLDITIYAGGSWLKTMPKKAANDVIIISCREDATIANKAIKAGFSVHDKEILLTGLLKQSLDIKSFRLTNV